MIWKYAANLQENTLAEVRFTLRNGRSPANLLHIFRTHFPKNTFGGLLLKTDSQLFSLSNSLDQSEAYLRHFQTSHWWVRKTFHHRCLIGSETLHRKINFPLRISSVFVPWNMSHLFSFGNSFSLRHPKIFFSCFKENIFKVIIILWGLSQTLKCIR